VEVQNLYINIIRVTDRGGKGWGGAYGRYGEEDRYNNIIYLFTALGLLPGGSGYFTCKQNMKMVTTRFNSGGLHEKHVVATWSLGNHLSICL